MSRLPAPYAPLARFAAQAAPQTELWRTGLGLGAIVMIYLASGWLLFVVLSRAMSDFALLGLLREIATGSTPRGVSLLLATFAPLLLATLFVTRRFHGRSAATLFGAGSVRIFAKVLPVLLAFACLHFVLALPSEHTGRSNPPATPLFWAPIALPVLMAQIAAEEALFRGYLLQQLAARWTSPWIWMVIPSALFGALHFAPGEYGGNALWPALWAFVYGCLAADLTARTGNLGAAMALHFVNNFGSLFLIGFYGQLDGLALYTIVINTRDFADLAPWLAADMFGIVISWLLVRLVLRV
ncbi:CPBP family intramembrane glutamic endopeptidase [Thioclava atlantica]|uniref:Abortive infection protein family n=1 Tax=Thioclava atlantica TaxID=1317124 RepID=A0A085TVJ1_9RHOB|nr:type II CAAX endopeptidase family protein [Thioclava atlantica]KFE34738.1 abortive infection protein family [Thioclava atlantica]